MEEILMKEIFDERILRKLGPDYTPSDVILRLQMRRSMIKDTHCYRIKKNSDFPRKCTRRTLSNKEIMELKSNYKKDNLRNELKLKETNRKKFKDVQETAIVDFDTFYNMDSMINDGTTISTDQRDKTIKVVQDISTLQNTSKLTGQEKKTDKQNNKASISNGIIHKTDIDKMQDLQSYLINLALSPDPKEDLDPLKNIEQAEINVNNDDTNLHTPLSLAHTCPLQINESVDFLNIKKICLPVNDKDLYLIKKYVDKWKEKVAMKKVEFEGKRKGLVENFLNKLKKKRDKRNSQDDASNKAAASARDFTTYKQRYKMQQHIIALQKLKLEEQNRVIEELKYNKIIEASKDSVDKMKEEVRKTYYDIDRHLKPKIKCLTNELKMGELEEPALVLHCLRVPQFLQRMEKRAREREEKHALIRERRKQMEEDRIKMKQQAELAKQEMDKEEKARRINELKEKRRKEKIEAIRKKEYAEKMRALTVMAELHYEKTLLTRVGLKPWMKLIEMKKRNLEIAERHSKFLVQKNVFLNWMWYTEDQCFERDYIAEDHYRKKLFRKIFNALKENHHAFVLKKQVAEDYYDFYVMQVVFRGFRQGIEVMKKETASKMLRATAYYNSGLKYKVLTCWRTLPALNALQREQEARKSRWREKVLQVVPDYVPPED